MELLQVSTLVERNEWRALILGGNTAFLITSGGFSSMGRKFMTGTASVRVGTALFKCMI
jgi:hypothetical protein